MTEARAARIVLDYICFHKKPLPSDYKEHQFPLDTAMRMATKICGKNSDKARVEWAKGCLEFARQERRAKRFLTN